MKYTIAKYYTPSGRCIQSVKYNGGRDGADSSELSFDNYGNIREDEGQSVPESERKTFYTKFKGTNTATIYDNYINI